MRVPPVNLPFLHVYQSDGKLFAYYRRDGRRMRIKALPGQADFPAAYESARVAWEQAPRRASPQGSAAPGTLSALIVAYKGAPEFRRLALKTRHDYGAILDMIDRRFGTALAIDLHRAWVLRLRDEVQDKPRSANYRVAVIRRLLSFAVDRGIRHDNPALRPGALETGPGHRPWTPAEIAAMTAPAAGDVRLPVLIARWTAQRLGDVLRLPWSAYDGSTIRLRQGKTGVALVLPVAAELRAALDAVPRASVVICLTSAGRPWATSHFSHSFAEARDWLGLPADLHFHGLRHTRLTELAEGGASDAEIMAWSGHKTRSMVSRYTAAAQQEGLAKAAVERLWNRNSG
jgi:integrase